MAEHPDNEPGHTRPCTCDCENPRGLLFISDVQTLRRAEAVSFAAADGVGLIDASLTTLAGVADATRAIPQGRPLWTDAARRRRNRPAAVSIG